MAGDAWGGTWGASWWLSWTRSAYVPITDEEFDAWLESGARRCILAEFSAVGYDVGEVPPTKTVYAYISNMGYTSHVTDSPSLKFYNPWIKKLPTFHRECVALTGRASVSFGNMQVTNPGAVRDDWLRMKWRKDYITLYIGDRSWAKSDFRKILVGRLKPPTAPAKDVIDFPIADLSELFEQPISSDLFASGPYANQRVPIYLGQIGYASHTGGQIEPPLTDEVNRIYTLCDTAIGPWLTDYTPGDYLKVYDNLVAIQGVAGLTVASVAGNVITVSDDHGFVVDYLVRFPFGSAPPAPLSLDTDYWVQSVPAADQFTVSATRGGSVISLSDTATGADVKGWGYTVTETAPASVQLATDAVGRVTVEHVNHQTELTTCGDVYLNVVRRMGLAEEFIDADTLADGFDIGLWIDTELHRGSEILERIANGSLTWYGFTIDGRFQNGEIRLPTSLSSPVLELNESNIKEGSLVLERVKPPVDFSTAQLRRDFWFLKGGPFQTGSQAALQGFTALPAAVYGTPAEPLDDHPTVGDADQAFKYDSNVTSSGQTSVLTRFKKTIGIFTLSTKLFALRRDLSIGSLITITHSRLGWKLYDAGDPQSPDNSADFDATKAVVIGMDVDLEAKDPFPVKLTVFRQIPGYYPEEDLN